MTDVVRHEVVVGYTLDDDGVWLICDTCGWEKSVGYRPTVDSLTMSTQEHVCYICGHLRNEPGSQYCSAGHGPYEENE